MKLKTSFCNKTIIKLDFRLYGFLGILYTLLFSFFVAIQPIISFYLDIKKSDTDIRYASYFDRYTDENMLTIFILIVPVLISLLLFHYVQNTRALSKIHSMPYTRTELFNSHVLSGLLLINIPVLISYLILWIGLFSMHLAEIDQFIGLYMHPLPYILLSQTAIFLVASAIHMMVGSTLLAGILTAISYILPTGLLLFIDLILRTLLYGYPEVLLRGNTFSFSLIDVTNGFYNLTKTKLLVFLVYSIVFYCIGLYLYKARHLETNNNFICFPFIQKFFVAGVTFCCMMVAGAFMIGIYGDSTLLFITGSIVGAVIGYFIAIGIAYKTLKVFPYYKGLIAFTLIIVCIFGLLKIDILGYGSKVPEEDLIQAVSFSETGRLLSSLEEIEKKSSSTYYGTLTDEFTYRTSYTYEREETIKHILAFHKKIISLGKTTEKDGLQRISFLYTMKDGSTLHRLFYVDKSLVTNEMKSIYESYEYKLKNNKIYRYAPDNILQMNILNYVIDTATTIQEAPLKEELLTSLKEDIMNLTYEEHLHGKYLFEIKISYDHENTMDIENYTSSHIIISPAYRKTLAVLKKHNLYDQFIIKTSDVSHIVLFSSEDKRSRVRELQNASLEDYKYITDKDKIQTILDNLHTNEYFTSGYIDHLKSAPASIDVYLVLPDNIVYYGYLTNKLLYDYHAYLNE